MMLSQPTQIEPGFNIMLLDKKLTDTPMTVKGSWPITGRALQDISWI